MHYCFSFCYDTGTGAEVSITKSAEPKPEDQVKISFLLQCLENAIATELTPCERGILCRDWDSTAVRARRFVNPASVHAHNVIVYCVLLRVVG